MALAFHDSEDPERCDVAWRTLQRKQRTKRALAALSGFLRTPNALTATSKSTLAILMYHSIHPTNSLSTRPEAFGRQLDALMDSTRIVSLDAAVLAAPTTPSGPRVALTFDDGYEDSWRFAWPAIRSRGLTATFFLCTGFMRGLASVRNRFKSYAEIPPLSWDMARQMSKEGATIGCHSDTHPNLARLPLDQALADVRRSKALLESELQREVTSFAFPYGFPGTYSRRLLAGLAEMGFHTVCTTEWGCESLPLPPSQAAPSIHPLRRIRIDPQDTLEDFTAKLNGRWNYIRWGQTARLLLQWLGIPVRPPQVIQ